MVSLSQFYCFRIVLAFLFTVGCCVDLAHGTESNQIRGFRIPKEQRQLERNLQPGAKANDPTFVVGQGGGKDSDFYLFDVDGLQPSSLPTNQPSPSPTDLPTDPPTAPPTDPPSKEPVTSPRDPSTVVVQAQEEYFLPQVEETEPTSNQREPNSQVGDEEPVQADEDLAPEGDVNPTDADQFLPAGDPTYYYVDLRPFSVFVEADRDLSADLGIPLYLLLEMGETLSTLVDIKITNMTIHMGVVETPSNVRHRRTEEDHYHWNQLFFHGLAQLDDSTVYPPVTVRNVQSLVLSNEEALQKFWDDEGYGDTYDNLELQNITLLSFPVEDPLPEKPDTVAPTQETNQQPTQELVEPENSKRDSNIWIMVPLVIVFFMFCFCIICLAGRLQYLSSRAQDKYNEKYGLDYNIYGKDLSKDIFKEEYLMSEHHDDHEFSQGSIDFLTNPIGSIKSATRRAKQPPTDPDEHSTEEEEEDMHGSPAVDERNVHYSRNGPMASVSQGSGGFPSYSRRNDNIVVDEGIILPRSLDIEEDDDGPAESVPQDEDEVIVTHLHSGVALDEGDVMPTMMKLGGITTADSNEKDESARSMKSRDSATFAKKENRGSGRNQRTTGSFSPIGDDRNALGNSSRSSRGSSRWSKGAGSFHSAIGEDPSVMSNSGRGDRSTRSNRSIRSDTSTNSFYSCQGDLV